MLSRPRSPRPRKDQEHKFQDQEQGHKLHDHKHISEYMMTNMMMM